MKRNFLKGSFSHRLAVTLRLVFLGMCGFALVSLLLHPPAVSTTATGGHVHSSSLTAEGVDGQSALPQSSAPPTPQSGKGSSSKSGNPQPSPSSNGQPGSALTTEGGAADRMQKSLGEAAAEPKGIGLHTEAANPAPVPRGAVDPGQVLDTASQSLGGCLKEYGDAGQCLPVVPPSLAEHIQQMKNAGLDPASMPHVWTCGEVRIYFPKGLAVRQPGVDPEHLDANHDGTACGADD